VKLVYLEKYSPIDFAFYREKQVQGWNRRKKQALIIGEAIKLPELAIAYRDKALISELLAVPSRASATAETYSEYCSVPEGGEVPPH
jgi:hypothetical protein